MKKIGLVLVAIGLAILAFVIYVYIRQSQQLISPVPEGQGIKVIYITPGAENTSNE